MTLEELYDAVTAHPDLEGVGIRDGEEAIIRHSGRHGVVTHALRLNDVPNHDWDEIDAVLTGEREPSILLGYSRIVGYYGRVSNWNKSKLAELRDRQKGDYGLPEGEK